MNLKKIAAAGLMTVTLLGLTATTATAATAATATTTVTRTPGVRIWSDDAGWHLRVTHNSLHDRVFSGEIVTTGEIVDVHGVRLERGDLLKVGPHKHGLVFRFNNYGGIDGFDFATNNAPSLGVKLFTDAHRTATSNIAIGADEHHPKHNPFVL